MSQSGLRERARGFATATKDRIQRERKNARDARPTTLVQPDSERPTSRALPQLEAPEQFRLTGAALVALGILLVGFALQFAGISQVSYARDQQLAFDDFRYQLANATAPVGQTGADDKLLAPGTPVSLISIPKLGLSATILEGTTSNITTTGPGHRRDTVLPGQLGASVVYGRQSSYGAPFGRIGELAPGDVITATTGQGEAKYTVTDVRYTGDPLPAPLAADKGRLTLVSASGLPFLPDTVVRVDATLTTAAQASPARVLSYQALDESELTMAGNSTAWPLLVLGLIILLVFLALVSISRRYWGKWQTWIVAVPVLLALGSFAAQQAAILLPNLL